MPVLPRTPTLLGLVLFLAVAAAGGIALAFRPGAAEHEEVVAQASPALATPVPVETPRVRDPWLDEDALEEQEICPDGMPIMIVYDSSGGSRDSQFYARLCNDYAWLTHRDPDTDEVWYSLFLRAERRIVHTRNIEEYLRAIEALPDGITIESIDKCTVSFGIEHVRQSNGEFEQRLLPGLDRILETFKRKRISTVGFGGEGTLSHKPHFFCLCEKWFKVLDAPLPNDAPPPTPVPDDWKRRTFR